MIEQLQYKNNDETNENIPSKEKDFSKEFKSQNISFKIYSDFVSQGSLFIQIILFWYLIHMYQSESQFVQKIEEKLTFLQHLPIDINIFLWSMNLIGFVFTLCFVSNHSRKIFFLHFFPFISVVFFVISAFYFHIIVLRKVKNILINPLSYIVIGGSAVACLEVLRNKLDTQLFLIGTLIFLQSNLLSWLFEWILRSDSSQLQSSFCKGYFKKILVEVLQLILQIGLFILTFWITFKLDYKIELIPILTIGGLQQINYILFKFSYSQMIHFNLQDLNISQLNNEIKQENKKTSHYVFIYYLNLILFFSLLFCISYYLPQLLKQQTVSNPQPSQPNKTQPIPSPKPQNNGTIPDGEPKNGTTPLPQPPKKNNTADPLPKNKTDDKNNTFYLPTIDYKVKIQNRNDTQQKNYTINITKNITIQFPIVKKEDKKPDKNNSTKKEDPQNRNISLNQTQKIFTDALQIIFNLETYYYQLHQKQNQLQNKQQSVSQPRKNSPTKQPILQNKFKAKNQVMSGQNITKPQYEIIQHKHSSIQKQKQEESKNNQTFLNNKY